MQNRFFHIEAETCQESKARMSVCGDACATTACKEEERLISILSDGLGSGVKANVLATMTTSMALQFTSHKSPAEKTAEFIMNTLPVDSYRNISYSTFSILDINHLGVANLVEYDNPQVLIYRDGRFLSLKREAKQLQSSDNKPAQIFWSQIQLKKEDRIIMMTDGVTQAGMGSDRYPLGWTEKGVQKFIDTSIKYQTNISATDLAQKIVDRAKMIDKGEHKDDTTCTVIYCRTPRKMLLVTGPPFHHQYDKTLAERAHLFKGKKVICGGTTSNIISRELNLEVDVDFHSRLKNTPPRAQMEGFDLITEGILTLGKVSSILENYPNETADRQDTCYQLAQMLINSDDIHILLGTKINNAHQDPSLPQELEIRRNIVKRISSLLETKFLKTVAIEYL